MIPRCYDIHEVPDRGEIMTCHLRTNNRSLCRHEPSCMHLASSIMALWLDGYMAINTFETIACSIKSALAHSML